MAAMISAYRAEFVEAARWSEDTTARADEARQALLAAARQVVAEEA